MQSRVPARGSALTTFHPPSELTTCSERSNSFWREIPGKLRVINSGYSSSSSGAGLAVALGGANFGAASGGVTADDSVPGVGAAVGVGVGVGSSGHLQVAEPRPLSLVAA